MEFNFPLTKHNGQLAGGLKDIMEPIQTNVRAFMSNFEGIDPDIRESLLEDFKSGEKRISTFSLYGVASLEESKTSLFQDGNSRKVGLRNVKGNKIDTGYLFLPTRIQLLAGKTGGTTGSPSEADIAATQFESLHKAGGFDLLKNGEIRFEVDKTSLMAKRNPIAIFCNTPLHEPESSIPVEFPIWVNDTKDLEVEITMPTGMTGDDVVKVVIEGVLIN